METIKAERGGYELVKIPGGSFIMGSSVIEKGHVSFEGPQHTVAVSDFYMGKYPVTNDEYALFLKDNPNIKKPYYWNNNNFNRPNQPVSGVGLREAKLYAEWAGLRFPSESEWEYACRARSTTRYYNGNMEEDLNRIGWYDKNSGGSTKPVGEKEPNQFGLYDMLGNVFEWVGDVFHQNYYGAPDDGSGWVTRSSFDVVIRGGAFFVGSDFCRSAFREGSRPDIPIDYIGFRLARSIVVPE